MVPPLVGVSALHHTFVPVAGHKLIMNHHPHLCDIVLVCVSEGMILHSADAEVILGKLVLVLAEEV